MLQFIIKRVSDLNSFAPGFFPDLFYHHSATPGDFLTTYINQLRQQGANIDDDTINSLEARYGMNEPMIVQYFKWVGRMLQGDLGYSFVWNRSVNVLIAERLGYTMILSLTSVILIWLIAFPLGFYSATHKYSLPDYTFTSISFFGLSIPEFLLALIFMWVYFAITGKFGGGMYSENSPIYP